MNIPTIREIEESEEWLENIDDLIKNSNLKTREELWRKVEELRVSDLKTVRSLRTIRAILKEKKCSAKNVIMK